MIKRIVEESRKAERRLVASGQTGDVLSITICKNRLFLLVMCRILKFRALWRWRQTRISVSLKIRIPIKLQFSGIVFLEFLTSNPEVWVRIPVSLRVPGPAAHPSFRMFDKLVCRGNL